MWRYSICGGVTRVRTTYRHLHLIWAIMIAAWAALVANTTAFAQPVGRTQNSYFVAMDALAQTLVTSAEFKALIKSHNERVASWSAQDIVSRDAAWRSGDRALIQSVTDNALAKALAAFAEAQGGQIAEIIVMGVRGCNIAAVPATSDYWQGDEAKFQKTFGANTNERFIAPVDFDQSANTFAQQISQRFTIDGEPAGVITIGFDIVYRPKKEGRG